MLLEGRGVISVCRLVGTSLVLGEGARFTPEIAAPVACQRCTGSCSTAGSMLHMSWQALTVCCAAAHGMHAAVCSATCAALQMMPDGENRLPRCHLQSLQRS